MYDVETPKKIMKLHMAGHWNMMLIGEALKLTIPSLLKPSQF